MQNANALLMNPYGLASVLGWPFFLGLALIVVALAIELLHVRLRPTSLIVLIAIFAFFIYGTASAVEPVAGLESSYIHAGFIQYILQHGHALSDYDARFSWPGAFSLGSVFVAFTGLHNAIAFLRWFPVVIELLYMAPLIVISRFSGVGRRAGWLGIIIYYASNWIYQDYFSPQALNFLFYLVIVATVLACWQPARDEATAVQKFFGRTVTKVRLMFARFRGLGRDTYSNWSAFRVLLIMILLSLVMLASAMSHQLTPFVIMLGLAACILTRRLGRPELLVVAFIFSVAWLSLGASGYWIGHLSVIFGGLGQVSGTLGQNVATRIVGSFSHRLIVDGRILCILALYSLGVVGALRRRPDSRALEALVVAPMLLLAAQSYGGEGLLRAVLFGLPFVSLLAASAFLPNLTGPMKAIVPQMPFRRSGRLVLGSLIAGVVFIASLGTVIVRGGNDAYESYTNGEFAAVNYTYNHITPGETLGLIVPNLPIGYRDVGVINIYSADGINLLPRVRAITFERNHAAWIILSQSQESWGVNVAGYPVAWESNLEGSLLSDGYTIAKAWPTATVLRAPASFIKKN